MFIFGSSGPRLIWVSNERYFQADYEYISYNWIGLIVWPLEGVKVEFFSLTFRDYDTSIMTNSTMLNLKIIFILTSKLYFSRKGWKTIILIFFDVIPERTLPRINSKSAPINKITWNFIRMLNRSRVMHCRSFMQIFARWRFIYN